MKKDLLFTFLTELIVLISGLLVYRFAANLVGKETFSQYALCRRTISFILPVLLMGLSVGIPRYIAFASSNNKYPHHHKYFLAGFAILLTNVLFWAGLLNIFKPCFSFLFFGNSQYDNLIFPISLMIIGLVLHATCYSYYRGRLLMVRANKLQILNSGVIPIIVFMCQKDITHILSFTGLSWIITSSVAMILICRNLEWHRAASLRPCVKELLTYGLQRVPGDFGMAALISLPAILTAHIAGMKEAGYVAFGTTILNMTGSLFAPFGLILLPKASQLIAGKNINKLKDYILKLAWMTFILTLVGLVFFEIFADVVIRLYLGSAFNDLLMIAKITMLGCLAYTFYVSMRSILDAYYTKAVNMLNITISLIFFLSAVLLVYVFNGDYIALVCAFVASLYILGILTLCEIRKLLSFKSLL